MVIKVDKYWYAALGAYMPPIERFTMAEGDDYGYILYSAAGTPIIFSPDHTPPKITTYAEIMREEYSNDKGTDSSEG